MNPHACTSRIAAFVLPLLITAPALPQETAPNHSSKAGLRHVASRDTSPLPYAQIAAGGVVRIVIPRPTSGTFSPLTEIAVETAEGKPLMGFGSETTRGADLPALIARAGEGSTILLSGSFSTTRTIALQAGQALIGAGTLAVKTASGRVMTVATPVASIEGTVPNDATVSMADNSRLTGLVVTNTSLGTSLSNAYGVWAVGVHGAVISNNEIRATGTNVAHAVAIAESARVIVLNNRLSGAGYLPSGLEVENSSDLRIAGNTLSASGSQWSNHAIRIANSYVEGGFTADSTGNTIATGSCQSSGGTSGSIRLAGGGRCPE
ncbi:MAG TPA: hypothetical protein VHB46_03765 [Burkholderiales bacterium]|nr:hypothetical protein [Burkholderiales bacterium]